MREMKAHPLLMGLITAIACSGKPSSTTTVDDTDDGGGTTSGGGAGERAAGSSGTPPVAGGTAGSRSGEPLATARHENPSPRGEW